MELVARPRVHKSSVCSLNLQDQTLFSSGEDGSVCITDLRSHELIRRCQVAEKDVAVPSIALNPVNENQLFCCVGASVLGIDVRQGSGQSASDDSSFFLRLNISREEINSVAINHKGTLLASADDAGEVAIIDIEAGTLTKSLKKGHTNIASSVTFRRHRPWEVISGGLDCMLLKWDFSAAKIARRWNLGEESRDQEKATQIINPPMIHKIMVPKTEERSLDRIVACARGDGVVSIYDLDVDRKDKQGKSKITSSVTQPIFRSSCHSSAVTSVCIPSKQPQFILSGGNDGMIVAQHWGNTLTSKYIVSEETEETKQAPFSWHHKRKINDLIASPTMNEVFVADTTSAITMYRVN